MTSIADEWERADRMFRRLIAAVAVLLCGTVALAAGMPKVSIVFTVAAVAIAGVNVVDYARR